MATFYTAVISALYDKEFGWPELAQALEDAKSGDGTLLLELADSYNGRHDDGTYDNIDQVIGAILCDDRFDPSQTYDEFVAEYRAQVSEYPLLGGYTGSTKLGCDPRLPAAPGERAARRRARHRHEADPRGGHHPRPGHALRRRARPRVSGSTDRGCSRFDSTEHTAYTKSACIDAAVDAYLLRGTLPAKGKVCRS